MRVLLLFIFGLALHPLNAQSYKTTKLIGMWELQSKTDGTKGKFEVLIDTPNNDSKQAPPLEITLNFQANNALEFTQNGDAFKDQYRVLDSTLFMGIREYKILKLTSTKLILMDQKTHYPATYRYKRIKKDR